MKRITIDLYHNFISRFAGAMAVMVFIITAVLLLIDYLGVRLNPIIGILTYTLLPGCLLFYLILIPIGMCREWRRRTREGRAEAPRFPRLDFNSPAQRKGLYVFVLGTSLVGLLVLAVSYRAYHFTESVYFCGELCHEVMKPEATTYRTSPHERVACVHCHVGEGATWYVKSKLSGLYQVWATLLDKYPRPIETPIANLRPSKETCEQCHWPQKFFGARQVMKVHYEEDEANTPRQFYMLMNVGGGLSPTGIHWHVGEDEVRYIARDRARQEIPWVKVRYKDGREATFVDAANPLTGDEEAKAEVRRMDCIDCHNRPTHIFRSPREAMDEALSLGSIDRSLPYIKKLGVELLSKTFASEGEAFQAIRDGVQSFYGAKYPELAEREGGRLEKAIAAIKEVYAQNNFPSMGSKWSIYPNNVGHLTWPGCFRCHDGNHKDDKGEAITKECNACHIFVSEKLGGLLTAEAALGRPFEHPADVAGQERQMPCTSCHAGR